MILLNLAYIPDEVIKGIKNFEFGWSSKFKESIENFYKGDQYEKWDDRRAVIKKEV